jgi:excisionase family DNA binding protein
MRKPTHHGLEELVYTVPEACQLGKFGTNTLYNAIKEGRLKVRKLGARTLILRDDFLAFLNSLPVSNEE